MKRVLIAGLFFPDLIAFNWESLKGWGEMWTVNNFVRCYPNSDPARIYQLHCLELEKISIEKGSMVPDWEDRYNSYENATVHVLYKHKILKNQIVRDFKVLEEKYGEKNLSCSISIMIYDAIEYGADEIYIQGVKLNKDEYLHQICGIMRAVRIARAKGIKVIMPIIREWEFLIKEEEAKNFEIFRTAPEFQSAYYKRKGPITKLEVAT